VTISTENRDLILHTMKAIADSHRRETQYCHEMLDMMCKELNVEIPERRKSGERRLND